jgi:hypothetical protein
VGTERFKDGKKDGRGTLFFKSGANYEGYFKEGEMHGQGTFRFQSGESVSGAFEKGIFIPNTRKVVKPHHKIIKIAIKEEALSTLSNEKKDC